MKHIFYAFIAAAILAGCASSTPDGPFVPAGKTIIFTEIIDSKATTLQLSVENSNTISLLPVTKMLESAGSNEVPSAIQSKLLKASQPNNLVTGIGAGFKEVLAGLGAVESKESRMDERQYIAEVTLLHSELYQSPENMFVIVEAEAIITHRMSGDVVWKEKGKKKIAIVPLVDGKRKENASVKELVELFSKPEFNVREAVLAASGELGRELAQKVRKAPTKWDVAPGR